MPLSEHEQRLLDQIEQALYADDPKFAATVRSARAGRRLRRGLLFAILGGLLGLALVFIGLATHVHVVSVGISVAGFVLLVSSCGLGIHAARNRATVATPNRTSAKTSRSNSGVRSKMEDRLRRRFDES
jgi:hypothetical protein